MEGEQPPAPREGRRAIDGLDWSQRPAAGTAAEPAPAPSPASPPGRSPGDPPPGTRPRAGLGLVAGVALAGALLGSVAGAGAVLFLDDDGGGGTTEAQPTDASGRPIPLQRTDAIMDVAEQARPGVIRIESTRRVGNTVEQDIGSGVVLDHEGHVLTNAHVVLGTETLKAVMPDGSERPAIVLGHDFPFTDLAVLQVGPVNLTPIPVGDSSRLRLGETVLAIGNPLAAFDGSVSSGVVSGLMRERVFDGVVQHDLIQTDAAINNGNSGGALLNLSGEFVGMPTAVLRENRGGQPVEGISFALPSNRVMEVARGIIAANGNYPRPEIGAETQELTPELAARLPRVAVKEGAIVTALAEGGPAALAGVAVGDVITQVGDQQLGADRPLLNALLAYEPDQSVRVVLNRNGRIIEVEVRLGRRA